jgi:hypothetical protein
MKFNPLRPKIFFCKIIFFCTNLSEKFISNKKLNATCVQKLPFQTIGLCLFRFSPDSPGQSTIRPAPPRGGTTGHHAGQGGGEPRLRRNSSGRPYHQPLTCTVLIESTFLGPTEPNRQDRTSKRGATGAQIVPHPARYRTPASRPCKKDQ